MSAGEHRSAFGHATAFTSTVTVRRCLCRMAGHCFDKRCFRVIEAVITPEGANSVELCIGACCPEHLRSGFQSKLDGCGPDTTCCVNQDPITGIEATPLEQTIVCGEEVGWEQAQRHLRYQSLETTMNAYSHVNVDAKYCLFRGLPDTSPCTVSSA